MTRYSNLERLLHTSETIGIDRASRVVVVSDLHLGDGGRNDEFRHNGQLFETVLRQRYLADGFSLVLNGDVEELFKFDLQAIASAWDGLYDLLLAFGRNGFFRKLYGNHDQALLDHHDYRLASALVESLALRYEGQTLLLFHGHQASPYLNEPSSLFSRSLFYLLRYLARPFGFRNYSVSYSSRKRFAIERSVYEFSNRSKIISIIGHTHRPLFESMSKLDYLNYRLEALCRGYAPADATQRQAIEAEIGQVRAELESCYRNGFRKSLRSGRYDAIAIPSIFNSGCCIGKRGLTAIEIEAGMIRLVYWTRDGHRSRSTGERLNPPEELGQSGFYRIVLNEDHLDYVFSRIHLLA
ncbi:metallophosphoesterase [Chlorobaculum thiosulfatiphilum]|uniref:Metallophosphoesterase n=1 Tax=Chlorobaculum thiosulfatiphilum TaxID=115852 RepID=A0A5C4SBS7_CHLTI|nr:metallophosphoesterase family protein [Chlorobaculum thiosulfatiphilum]TNJ40379.1 metallophosphoesterase [Chlorobaculum thiosulfatiphilum]